MLVLSAYDANEGLVRSLGAHWMAKPWNGPALQAKVRELLQEKQERAPRVGGRFGPESARDPLWGAGELKKIHPTQPARIKNADTTPLRTVLYVEDESENWEVTELRLRERFESCGPETTERLARS